MVFMIIYLFISVIVYMLTVYAVNVVAGGDIVEAIDFVRRQNGYDWKYLAGMSANAWWLVMLVLSLLWPYVVFHGIHNRKHPND